MSTYVILLLWHANKNIKKCADENWIDEYGISHQSKLYSLIGARYMVVLLYISTFFVNVNVLIRAHRLMSTAQKNKVQDLHLHFHCVKVQQHNRCCRLSTCRICVWHAYSKLRRQKQENIIMELQLYITLFEAVFMKVLHEWLVITD